MSKIYVISDPHFGHLNMAKNRGFNSVEEHDNHIIESWNKVLTKNDTIWILGDITMEKKQHYHLLDQIRGIKKVVLGNHDQPQHIPELLKHVNSVCGMFQLKGYMLSHCPIHENELKYFRKNIHGHVHYKTIPDDRYINVCCEVVDYKPQLLSNL